MTLPVEPASVPHTESETPKKTLHHFEAWGIKLPLPRWAILCLGFLAIVGSAASIFVEVVYPKLNQVQGQFLQPLPTPEPTVTTHPRDTATKSVDVFGSLQYTEYKNHKGQKPWIIRKVPLSHDLGALEIEFFISDGCIHIVRTRPGVQQAFDLWVPSASFADAAPGDISHSGAVSPGDSVVDDDGFEALMQNASFAPRNEPAVSVATSCLDPHPGEFRWWNGEQRGCWLQVWRAWPDGCQHFQWFNSCNGYWDSYPNGAPRVYWTNCVH